MNTKLALVFLGCSVALTNQCFSQKQQRASIYVTSVDFSILTFAAFSCDKFESNFQGRMNMRLIDKKDSIQILDSFLRKVKYAKRSHELDVREKLIYEKINEPSVRICTTGYDIAIDGRLIKHNDKFVEFLRSMTL